MKNILTVLLIILAIPGIIVAAALLVGVLCGIGVYLIAHIGYLILVGIVCAIVFLLIYYLTN